MKLGGKFLRTTNINLSSLLATDNNVNSVAYFSAAFILKELPHKALGFKKLQSNFLGQFLFYYQISAIQSFQKTE